MKLTSLFLVALVAVVVAAAVVTAQDYCSLNANHTMCIYSGVGSACAPRLDGGVPTADQATIVKTHNDLRQKVAQGGEAQGKPGPQPAAANMRMMTWDNELATVAQRWADQCTMRHDSCRKVPQFSAAGVGQNLAWFGGETPTWPAAINNWYNEVQNFSSADVTPFKFTSGTGHYTQVVWANSYLIGCGYSKYTSPGKAYTQYLYACNYGPAGNLVATNSNMYTKGSAATLCPTGTAASKAKGYPGLCS